VNRTSLLDNNVHVQCYPMQVTVFFNSPKFKYRLSISRQHNMVQAQRQEKKKNYSAILCHVVTFRNHLYFMFLSALNSPLLQR